MCTVVLLRSLRDRNVAVIVVIHCMGAKLDLRNVCKLEKKTTGKWHVRHAWRDKQASEEGMVIKAWLLSLVPARTHPQNWFLSLFFVILCYVLLSYRKLCRPCQSSTAFFFICRSGIWIRVQTLALGSYHVNSRHAFLSFIIIFSLPTPVFSKR